MFNGATNFYNLNNENFHDFLMEMYRKIDLLDKDTNYIRNHLIDELRKELRKIIANGELIVDIESVVDDFLINGLAKNKVVRDIKKKLEECSSQLEHKAENKVVRDIKKKLEECNSQLDTNVRELKNSKASKVELDIERKRIDSFVSLPEGSTTGDAELIDGRVGVDGKTYENIGNAIRGQFKKVNKTTDDILKSFNPKIVDLDVTLLDNWIEVSGASSDYNNWKHVQI